MTNVEIIFNFLKEKAPLDLAESWDNSGLLIRGKNEVENVLFTMDVTDQVVQEAIEKNCQMIVSHHPVIFRPLKALDGNHFIGKVIKNDITVISMHTNLDRTEGGVNDVLAHTIGLHNVVPFAEELGRIGELDHEISVAEFSKSVAKALNTTVKYTLPEKMIRKVALIGGAAGEYWTEAKAEGADVFLTGEASHHHSLDAKEEGFAIIVGGHWNTERPVLYALAEEMQKKVSGIQTLVSENDIDPFCYT